MDARAQRRATCTQGRLVTDLIHNLQRQLGPTVLIVAPDIRVAESCKRTIHIRVGQLEQDVHRESALG